MHTVLQYSVVFALLLLATSCLGRSGISPDWQVPGFSIPGAQKVISRNLPLLDTPGLPASIKHLGIYFNSASSFEEVRASIEQQLAAAGYLSSGDSTFNPQYVSYYYISADGKITITLSDNRQSMRDSLTVREQYIISASFYEVPYQYRLDKAKKLAAEE